MKIMNTKAGEAYQLSPGTQLEIERPNLFFNEWGEQSLPVDLPDTDRNRRLCGYPDMLGNVQRPRADIECTVQEGAYYQIARQAILGAKRKESITTTLYLNEGCFLAKVDDTLVSDVFGDETVEGISTVEQAIDFCRQLARNGTGHDERFAIFPVLSDSDVSGSSDQTVYRVLNRYGKFDQAGIWNETSYVDVSQAGWDFYNAVDRSEQNGEDTIQIPAGFYITPFIKANYLLRRILQYFGYTLQDNFFTQTHPFTEMVFVNNCFDTLANGYIRLSDLVPECTCGDILNVFRKKFCCEFITDEVKRTATIVLMNDVLQLAPEVDLSAYLTGHLLIESPESYKRITIQSEDAVEGDVENPESLATMASGSRHIEYSTRYCAYYRCGTIVTFGSNGRVYGWPTVDYISNATQPYDSGESQEAQEITVPDCQLCFRTMAASPSGSSFIWRKFVCLYIGGGKFLNSKLVESNADGATAEEEDETNSDNEETRPMLAFAHGKNGYPQGTIGTTYRDNMQYVKLWDYSLSYTGQYGIYERFYRKMDNLYRNSLLTVTANLLLPDDLKQSLSSYKPVCLDGQVLLPNMLCYAIGGQEQPMESTFYTMRNYEPISTATQAAEYGLTDVETRPYYWTMVYEEKEITKEEYETSTIRDRDELAFYPDKPSEKHVDGKRHYQLSTDRIKRVTDGTHYVHYDVWLECRKSE